MGGPTYRYDEENASTTKFPEYWDGKAFLAEFSRDRLFAFSQEDADGAVTKIEDFLPNASLNRRACPRGQRDRLRVRSGRIALRARLR